MRHQELSKCCIRSESGDPLCNWCMRTRQLNLQHCSWGFPAGVWLCDYYGDFQEMMSANSFNHGNSHLSL